MDAPVNVLLEHPTIELDGWDELAEQWIELNTQIGGNPEFYPLTIKGAYVIGIIHQLCEAVSILLEDRERIQKTYLPAFGVFASGIERNAIALGSQRAHYGSRGRQNLFQCPHHPRFQAKPFIGSSTCFHSPLSKCRRLRGSAWNDSPKQS